MFYRFKKFIIRVISRILIELHIKHADVAEILPEPVLELEIPVKTEKELAHEKWVLDKGDATLRLDYADLTHKDVVVDLGGFYGQWASDIYSRHLSKIYIFEPVEEFANLIHKRFIKNPNIILNRFAAGKSDGYMDISVAGDASSIHSSGEVTERIEVISFSNWLNNNHINEIALMKINIEGGEYDLLEDLIQKNLVSQVKNLQIQFHDFVPDAEKRMQKIQNSLSKTHKLTYQYKFVWENWEKI